MIKLFSLKQQKKDEEGSARAGGSQKKASAAQLRITKDLNELNLPKTCSTEFPDPDDLLNFKLIICPDEGFYRGGRFVFSFKDHARIYTDTPEINRLIEIKKSKEMKKQEQERKAKAKKMKQALNLLLDNKET